MAGSFIQSSTEVKNFDLTRDQITSYSAAVLSVEIVKEDYGFANGHNFSDTDCQSRCRCC